MKYLTLSTQLPRYCRARTANKPPTECKWGSHLFVRCFDTEWVISSQCVRYSCRPMHAICSLHTQKGVKWGQEASRTYVCTHYMRMKNAGTNRLVSLLSNRVGCLRLNTKPVNNNIKRASFPLPMRNEIFAERAEATFFSKLDASVGIWQNVLNAGFQTCT